MPKPQKRPEIITNIALLQLFTLALQKTNFFYHMLIFNNVDHSYHFEQEPVIKVLLFI